MDLPMTDKLTREEKLAAKLRENLHRRKAQARALSDQESRARNPGDRSPALPKGDSTG